MKPPEYITVFLNFTYKLANLTHLGWYSSEYLECLDRAWSLLVQISHESNHSTVSATEKLLSLVTFCHCCLFIVSFKWWPLQYSLLCWLPGVLETHPENCQGSLSSTRLALCISNRSRQGNIPDTVHPPTEAQVGSLLCNIFIAFIIQINYIEEKPKPCCGPHGNRSKELWLIINQGIQTSFLLQRFWAAEADGHRPGSMQPGAVMGVYLLFPREMENRKPPQAFTQLLLFLCHSMSQWDCLETSSPWSWSLKARSGISRAGIWNDKVFASRGESFP